MRVASSHTCIIKIAHHRSKMQIKPSSGDSNFEAMRLNTAHMQPAQLVWMIVLAITSVAATAQPVARLGCIDKCGNISIPYPFGIGWSSEARRNCFFDNQSFEVTCHQNTTLKSGNFTVSNISLEGQLEMSFPIARVFYNGSGRISLSEEHNMPSLRMPAFTISSKKNKFITVGCDSVGYLRSFRNNSRRFTTLCYSYCYNDTVYHGREEDCYGKGCCQVDIPCGIENVSIAINAYNESTSKSYSYAFIVKQDSYNFSLDEFSKNVPKSTPMVVDWAIGNWSCADARNKPNFACNKNSECVDTDHKYGYRCRCKDGYDGNPYHPDGCHDANPCRGLQCQLIKLAAGVTPGLLILVVLMFSLCWVHKQRTIEQLRRKHFKQNGGLMLEERLSERIKTFKEAELEKATNNFHESRIVGRGGHGVVYKGILPDNTPVAIKKSTTGVGLREVNDFINEMVVLSQINHRNVVNLLGFCLETEVPLLVYEFVSNGTLLHHIDPRNECTISWETRLRIATDTAEAISYLHSFASIPIIHRDIKSTNILLDQNNKAKVSDFGASRLVPLDEDPFSTLVQGTPGYLDPEYLRTTELNEKSDVYSFGVVLMELLTGKKAVEFNREKQRKYLVMEFVCLMEEGRLLEILDRRVMNERNVDQLKKVALLAERCVKMKGNERPSMKEVAAELDGLIMVMEKQTWVKGDVTPKKNEHLLGEASGLSGDAGIGNSAGDDSIQNQMPLEIGNGR